MMDPQLVESMVCLWVVGLVARLGDKMDESLAAQKVVQMDIQLDSWTVLRTVFLLVETKDRHLVDYWE